MTKKVRQLVWYSLRLSLIGAFYFLGVSTSGCGGAGGGGDPAVPVLWPIPTNDIAWDAKSGLIYLSVPAEAGPNGNVILALAPQSGRIVHRQFAGSEPDVLALSDDGNYLYAGVNGSASVKRFKLPGLELDTSISLGAEFETGGGPFYAQDLQVAPGRAKTFAVSRSIYTSPQQVFSLAIFDDATARPIVAPRFDGIFDSLQWGDNDSALFAGDTSTTAASFYKLSVDINGVDVLRSYYNAFRYFAAPIHYAKASKRIFSDEGTVLESETGRQLHRFDVRGAMVPDELRNRIFFATRTNGANGELEVRSYDAITYEQVGYSEPIKNPTLSLFPRRLIRWGSEGLALSNRHGPVFVFGSRGAPEFDSRVPVGKASQALIPIIARKIVWDPVHKLIYASVPSGAATNPNSVVAINPRTSQVVSVATVGNEPDALAISDNGQYLYVGLNQVGAIERLSLPSLTRDIVYSLGSDPFYGPYFAGDIEVAPGLPETTAVTLLVPGIVPTALGGIKVFDNAVARKTMAPAIDPRSGEVCFFSSLQWGANSDTLYATDNRDLGVDLQRLSVDGYGVRLEKVFKGVFVKAGDIQFNRTDGLIYQERGRVVDPSTALPSGVFVLAADTNTLMTVTDFNNSRAFSIWIDSSDLSNGPEFRIQSFDTERYTPVETFGTSLPLTSFPTNFIRWSDDGIAFSLQDGIHLVYGPFVSGAAGG